MNIGSKTRKKQNFNTSLTFSAYRDTEDTYTFSDGTNFTKDTGSFGSANVTWTADFTPWKASQPVADDTTRENQDCVKSDQNGLWDDVVCGSLRYYACQIPAGATPAGRHLFYRGQPYYNKPCLT